MPVAGFIRRRRHQFGRQATFGTAVAAKRAYPFKGVPDYGEPWEQPDVDTGSIVDVAAPNRVPNELSAPLTDPVLRYNSIPLLLSAFFGGGVAATGGTAKTRLYTPDPTTVEPIDVFTYEFGDDVTTDWMQMRDGILMSFEVNGPEGLGALSTSMAWRFGDLASSGFTDSPDSPVVPTALTVDPNEAIAYLKDLSLFIASDPYDLAYSSFRIADALQTFSLRFTKEVDDKRFAQGSQSFAINAYGVTAWSVELECTFAKTADTVGLGSESDAWYSDQAVDRYVRLLSESTVDADTGVPYSWDQSFPLRYRTRTEGEVGGNSVVGLTGKNFFAPTHDIGAYSAEVINTLADANF